MYPYYIYELKNIKKPRNINGNIKYQGCRHYTELPNFN